MTTKTNFYRGLLTSVALSSLCFTANANPLKGWKPYVGAGAGYSVVDFKRNYWAKDSGSNTSQSSSSATAKGAVESLFVGVQKQINAMALGAEFYGYLSQQNAKMTSSSSAPESSINTAQRQYGYGLKLKAGYFVNPTALAYVHVGIENARFKYAGVDNIGTDHNNFKKNKSLMGMPIGAGLEVDISSAWKTRLEYTYTKYQSWKMDNVASIARETITSKLSPRQHTIMVGFAYQI